MENIEYKELGIDDIHSNILDYYNRYHEVKKCYRNENGKWVIKKIEYVEDWDKDKKENIIKDFSKIINNGGYIFGAYEDNKLIGFAVLVNKKFGSRKQYILLDNMQVSFGYRNRGIGKKLFELCVKRVKETGIEKIYISAHTAEETQAFYLNIGCIDTEEINRELAEKEPYDRQMEYKA
ncbi:MAG: GNAT family N-acetyltransferase [Treponema sp.]|nr:GNAT family N-acetyltransferase [Treponema sp.]